MRGPPVSASANLHSLDNASVSSSHEGMPRACNFSRRRSPVRLDCGPRNEINGMQGSATADCLSYTIYHPLNLQILAAGIGLLHIACFTGRLLEGSALYGSDGVQPVQAYMKQVADNVLGHSDYQA